MDDDKLIQLVEQNDILYNKNHPDFKDPKIKIVIWQSIAAELEISVDHCVKRWTTLRERFSRECRRTNEGEYGEEYKSRWPHYDLISFLKPHLTYRANRKSLKTELANLRSNPDPLSISISSVQFKPAQLPSMTYEKPRLPIPAFVPKISPVSSIASPVPSAAPSPPLTSEHALLTYSSSNKRINVDKIFSDAIETFKKVRAAREIEVGSPGVRGFGDMIVSILSSMSERKQIKAMQKATEIVMSIKLQSDD